MSELNLNNEDLKIIQDKTKLNRDLIMEYYKSFLISYPNGRISKQKFIDEIVFRLVIVDEKKESIKVTDDDEIKNEKTKLCVQLFNICDADETGEVDFIEYFTLFWSRAKGNSSEKLR